MNTASAADVAKNLPTGTAANVSLTASAANAPNVTDLLIYPVEAIKFGADTAFELYSDGLGPFGGFAANEFYKNAEAQFSDPNLLQKAAQIQKQKDQEFQQYQAKQHEFWNAINSGFDETSSTIQGSINNVLEVQTNTISAPTH